MSVYRAQPDLNSSSMGVKPRRLQFAKNDNISFPSPPPPQPTPEDINRSHTERMNQLQFDDKSESIRQNRFQKDRQFSDRREQDQLSFMQKEIAKRAQAQEKLMQGGQGGSQGNTLRPFTPPPPGRHPNQSNNGQQLSGNFGYPQPQNNSSQQVSGNFGRPSQPSWGGNSLGNVVRQPNYPRVDYLQPVKKRTI